MGPGGLRDWIDLNLFGHMRRTKALDLEAAQSISAAAAFARSRGWPLNQMVTIHWRFADGDTDHRRRLARLLERARHWFSRRGFPLAWIWVFERGKAEEMHTHILFHVPLGFGGETFREMLGRWIGGNIVERLLDVKPCNAAVLRYLLKDADPGDYAELGIPPYYASKRSTRIIEGKRCGFSQALGPAARARAELAPVTDLEQAA